MCQVILGGYSLGKGKSRMGRVEDKATFWANVTLSLMRAPLSLMRASFYRTNAPLYRMDASFYRMDAGKAIIIDYRPSK